MDKLGMERAAALAQAYIQRRHAGLYDLAISAPDAVHQRDKVFFDPGLHVILSMQPNTDGARVKRDCNMPG
jgi:hypothetical protein